MRAVRLTFFKIEYIAGKQQVGQFTLRGLARFGFGLAHAIFALVFYVYLVTAVFLRIFRIKLLYDLLQRLRLDVCCGEG